MYHHIKILLQCSQTFPVASFCHKYVHEGTKIAEILDSLLFCVSVTQTWVILPIRGLAN